MVESDSRQSSSERRRKQVKPNGPKSGTVFKVYSCSTKGVARVPSSNSRDRRSSASVRKSLSAGPSASATIGSPHSTDCNCGRLGMPPHQARAIARPTASRPSQIGRSDACSMSVISRYSSEARSPRSSLRGARFSKYLYSHMIIQTVRPTDRTGLLGFCLNFASRASVNKTL